MDSDFLYFVLREISVNFVDKVIDLADQLLEGSPPAFGKVFEHIALLIVLY
jgi:hypothetical protein